MNSLSFNVHTNLNNLLKIQSGLSTFLSKRQYVVYRINSLVVRVLYILGFILLSIKLIHSYTFALTDVLKGISKSYEKNGINLLSSICITVLTLKVTWYILNQYFYQIIYKENVSVVRKVLRKKFGTFVLMS